MSMKEKQKCDVTWFERIRGFEKKKIGICLSLLFVS